MMMMMITNLLLPPPPLYTLSLHSLSSMLYARTPVAPTINLAVFTFKI
jgi:hypothetical protein